MKDYYDLKTKEDYIDFYQEYCFASDWYPSLLLLRRGVSINDPSREDTFILDTAPKVNIPYPSYLFFNYDFIYKKPLNQDIYIKDVLSKVSEYFISFLKKFTDIYFRFNDSNKIVSFQDTSLFVEFFYITTYSYPVVYLLGSYVSPNLFNFLKVSFSSEEEFFEKFKQEGILLLEELDTFLKKKEQN